MSCASFVAKEMLKKYWKPLALLYPQQDTANIFIAGTGVIEFCLIKYILKTRDFLRDVYVVDGLIITVGCFLE